MEAGRRTDVGSVRPDAPAILGVGGRRKGPMALHLPPRPAGGHQRPERHQQLRRPRLHDGAGAAADADLHPAGLSLPRRVLALHADHRHSALHRGDAGPDVAGVAVPVGRPPLPPTSGLPSPERPAHRQRGGGQSGPADLRRRPRVHDHDALAADPVPERQLHHPGVFGGHVVDQSAPVPRHGGLCGGGLPDRDRVGPSAREAERGPARQGGGLPGGIDPRPGECRAAGDRAPRGSPPRPPAPPDRRSGGQLQADHQGEPDPGADSRRATTT